MTLSKLIIICGHYGCGKTNLAINLAVDLKKSGRPVTLVDLDIVNPYFRSSNYADILKKQGIHLIEPTFARSNADLPALPPTMYAAFESGDTVIVDAGGDDVGATVLGRFAANIKSHKDYMMLYVVNRYRMMTQTAGEAVEILKEIETVSRVSATHIVNNSHLSNVTTKEDIENSMDYAKEVSEKVSLPLLFTTVPKSLYPSFSSPEYSVYPVEVFVKPEWEKV